MRAAKLNLAILLVTLIPIAACELSGNAQRQQIAPDITPQVAQKQETPNSEKGVWLDYWPAVVELRGKLGVETFFGPPNFGENPRTDSKERSWILSLDEPINVRAETETDSILGPSTKNVQKLQLVLSGSHKELIGKEVIVKGTLFHAHTAFHHTDVLIDVESIRLAKPD